MNLIAQLAGGVRALTAPVDNLVSNGAYMLMTSLAWTLKAWAELLLPVEPRKRKEHGQERCTWLRMEFKTFVQAVVHVPCQIVRQVRRTIYRVLSWNPYLTGFFRLCNELHCSRAARRREKSPVTRAAAPSGRSAHSHNLATSSTLNHHPGPQAARPRCAPAPHPLHCRSDRLFKD